NEFEYAPISKGETLGRVEYLLDGEVVSTCSLISSEEVLKVKKDVKLSFKEKILKFIYQF
ncbi:MAG: hypothetical protein UDO63_03885, partial [Oscillospiraceae bacterium]